MMRIFHENAQGSCAFFETNAHTFHENAQQNALIFHENAVGGARVFGSLLDRVESVQDIMICATLPMKEKRRAGMKSACATPCKSTLTFTKQNVIESTLLSFGRSTDDSTIRQTRCDSWLTSRDMTVRFEDSDT